MPEPGNHTTVIGADTHIKGDMSFDGTARILGTFEGTIAAKGELQIAEGAKCRAAVEASKVLVDGAVEGNLTGRERVELSSKARVKGDLVTARLVVAEGAAFVGHCTVGPEIKGGPEMKGGADMSKGGKSSDGAHAAMESKQQAAPQRLEVAARK